MRDLGVLGGLSSYGMAINAYNHVAGYSTRQANDERVHAFLHDGKSMDRSRIARREGNRKRCQRSSGC